MNKLPIVAIVGAPNAGKSTLLNKIAGTNLAVTSEVAGTTRDRQYLKTAWNGLEFLAVDTAGLDLSAQGELETNIQKQIDFALKEADVILLVADGKEPTHALDQKVLVKFRKIKKPKILAINKVDSPKIREEKLKEFAKYGVRPSFAVSSLTGRGIGDLMDEITNMLKQNSEPETKEPAEEQDQDSKIQVALVGKPNVGKSSLFNAILQKERVVVSEIPGTTRTSIDEELMIDGDTYIFIDTAGLKKKDHKQSKPDIYSTFQTFKSIRRSDVCVFMVDANAEITVQDQRVAREILDMQKGCVIVASKSDLLDTKKSLKNMRAIKKNADDRYQSFRDYISHHFPFLWMCPLIFVSSVTGDGIEEVIAAIKPIFDRRAKEIDNQALSEFLMQKLKKSPPKRLRDQKEPKVYSLKQLATKPPTFELLVNHPAAISLQFRKFLENSIIKELDFWGTPIKLHLRKKIG